jgi:squalene-hopene/tetraprenyl-beta-curcumene cyclase
MTMAGLLATALLTGGLLAGGSDRPQSTEQSPPTTKPLDPRIDPQRVTESDPPPLPEQVILPKPPDHRIAASADLVPVSGAHYERAVKAIERGLASLEKAIDPRGGWRVTPATPTDEPEKQSPADVAVTALALKAFLQADDANAQSPVTLGAVQAIRAAQADDGSFEGGALTNYVTSAVVMALSSLDRSRFGDEINGGLSWLQASQWDETEGLGPRQDWFGGAGYGGRGRPDLSNTQTMLDAMYDAGVSPDEPAFQRALAFASRAQNLQATNDSSWAGNDGGFVYTPANGGESMASEKAGEGRDGRAQLAAGEPRSLRSYGSMTYAGFKSMLYAGLSPDDVRVRAAFDWLCRHWTFEENPGLGQQGLYYYYHTMARALTVSQQHRVEDETGRQHNWREELIDAIVGRQRDDGSWKNDADRWLEGEPVLATVYAVLALEEAIKPALELER